MGQDVWYPWTRLLARRRSLSFCSLFQIFPALVRILYWYICVQKRARAVVLLQRWS